MKHIKLLIIICFTLGLMACDSRPNFADLCNSHPKICNEFQEDTWCKAERIKVGMSNYAYISEPNKQAENQFNRLLAYEKYAKCMDFASQIEHIKLKHKQTLRIENAQQAKQKIKEISEQTKNTNHPYLLYYHWSRYIDKDALNRFLKMEGSSALENSRSQFHLATHYIKRDHDKTLDLLFHALELHNVGEEVEQEIFKSISSIFAVKQNAKLTYIWLKVAQLNDPSDKSIKNDMLKSYINGYNLNAEKLNLLAQLTLDKIKTGTFTPPKH